MSDHWEVVGGVKRKPKVGNGFKAQEWPATARSTATVPSNSKPAQKTRKKKHMGPREEKIAPPPSFYDDEESVSEPTPKPTPKPKKQTQKQPSTGKKENKPRDLESALKNVPAEQLQTFYEDLTSAGSLGDVYLSWIKYSADALNSQLNQVPTPSPEQWPNDLSFPRAPKSIEATIQHIITETARSREDIDVIGLSFTTLLSAIPTLLQRGDAGWGYLLFLREMCKIDPELPVRRAKSFSELMESYGNRKEVGICILWVAAQASLYSDNVLKIVTDHIVPFYNYKHYKSFVLSVLSTLSDSAVMAGDNVVEPDEFIQFFEAAFDPKKKKDFEKFYPKVRHLAVRNLRGRGSIIFFSFLERLADKDFMPLSAMGKEVFDILNGCLSNDPSCIEKWREQLAKYPRQSGVLLNYLSKHPESVNYASKLETGLIQTDEFARAAVKAPELLRTAKKLQVGFQRVEASKKRFSWKMGCFLLLLTITGLLYLDVTENGKGSFAKSNTGLLLEKYGFLDEATLAIDYTTRASRTAYDFSLKLFRNVNERVRPLLQSVEKQVDAYIPEVVKFFKSVAANVTETLQMFFEFLKDRVFVGTLAPENLRKIAKETLAFIWTNLILAMQKLYEVIERYIQL